MDEYAQGELKRRLLELGWPEQEVDVVIAKQRQEELGSVAVPDLPAEASEFSQKMKY